MSDVSTLELAARRDIADAIAAKPPTSYWQSVGRRLLRDPVTIGVTLVLLRA